MFYCLIKLTFKYIDKFRAYEIKVKFCMTCFIDSFKYFTGLHLFSTFD